MDTKKNLWDALEKADIKGFREALASHPELARARDEHGISIVLQAAYRRRKDMVDALLSYRNDLDIFEASALGKVERMNQLLGKEPHLARAWSPDGFTPLHLGCFFGHTDCVRILIENDAEVSTIARNATRVTPINSAAASGRLEIVEILLKKGAEVDAAQQAGFTALHAAAHAGNEAMVELLLSHGARPERMTEDGRTAAAMAREEGHEVIAERLERASRTSTQS